MFRKRALAIQLSGLVVCLLILGVLVSASIFQQEKHREQDRLLTYLVEKSHIAETLVIGPDGDVVNVDQLDESNKKMLIAGPDDLNHLGRSAQIWLVEENQNNTRVVLPEKTDSFPGGRSEGQFVSFLQEAKTASVHSMASDGEITVVYTAIDNTNLSLALSVNNKDLYQGAITTVFLVCVSLATIGLFLGLLIYFLFLHIYHQVDQYIGELEVDLEKKQEQLRDELKSHEFVVNNATDYLARFSSDNALLYASEGVERVIGYNKDEVNKIDHLSLIHDEDKERVYTHVNTIVRTQGQGSVEFRLKHKNGSWVWVEGACRAVSGMEKEKNDSTQTIWIIRDITARLHAEDKLKDSEERLREIAENINGFFWLREGRKMLYVSPKIEKFLHLKQDEFIENPNKVVDSIHPEDKEKLRLELEKSLAGERPLNVEVRVLSQQSDVRWIHARVYPVGEPKNNRFAGFAEDITERKKVQMELEESRQRHREAQRVAKLGHWELDLVSKALYWSDEAYRIFGMAPKCKEMTDNDFYNLIHPGDRRLVIDAYLNSLKTREPYKITHRIVLEGGTEKIVQEQCHTVYNEKGQPLRSFGTVLDITDLAKAEQQLRSQSEFLEKLLENMPVGLWVKDGRQDLRYVFWNAFMEKITGVQSDQIIGKTDVEIGGSEEAYLYREEDLDILSNPRRLEIPLRSFFGRQVNIIKIPILDDQGIPSSVLGLMTDITDRIEAERNLRHAQKMEAIGQITGGLAHDFNNILQVIQGGCYLLESSAELAGSDNEELQNISDAVNSGMSLTRQLLAFSRNKEVELEPISLNSQVINMSTMLKRVLGENISFQYQVDKTAELINGDPAQIEQILMNLCVNARDAMPGGGLLYLETKREYIEHPKYNAGKFSPGFYLVLTVQDTGDGIDQEHLEKVFEPFYTTKQPGKGTGLGLATVYNIVQNHQGWIDVESEKNHGTKFSIYFPEVVGCENSEEYSLEQVSIKGGKESILFVEDHVVISQTVTRTLSAFGYAVTVAFTAEQALELYSEMETKPDLLLSDVVLPKMNGCELCQILRNHLPSLPVVFCSGYTREKLAEEYGIKIVDEVLLKKPYHHNLLLQTVRSVLDEVPAK